MDLFIVLSGNDIADGNSLSHLYASGNSDVIIPELDSYCHAAF